VQRPPLNPIKMTKDKITTKQLKAIVKVFCIADEISKSSNRKYSVNEIYNKGYDKFKTKSK
jgi:hypothetical protein